MAIQRLRLLSLCLSLCLATAFAAGRQLQLQQQQQAPSSSSGSGSGYCYETVMKAPNVCAAEFIQVIFSGGNKKLIGDICCEYLVCVHEASCVEELRKICSPKVMGSKCEGFYPLPPPPAVVADVSVASHG